MDTLILITKMFPLEKGDIFLNNEIEHLSNNFDRILIFPCSVNKKSRPLISLPSNVEVYGLSSRNLTDKIRIFFRMLGNVTNQQDIKVTKGNLRKKIFRSYFYSSSRLIYKKIKKIIKNNNFTNDNIYLYSYWMYDIALVAIWLKKLFKNNKVTCITRAHGYDLYEYRNKLNYLPFREYIFENIDCVYCCSKNGEDYLKNKYPQYISKITHSYLGTNDNGIHNYTNESENIIVSCSIMDPIKRIDLLIDSLAILKETEVIFKWYHIGDGVMYEELKNKAEALLGLDNFTFLGYLSNDKVLDFYRNSNIKLFINTSSTEGLPVSIMEAISFGIPAVATNVGGTSEIVVDGQTGILIPSNPTSKEIAEAIHKIISLEIKDYDELRINTRQLWEEKYSSKINYLKFIDNFKEFKCK